MNNFQWQPLLVLFFVASTSFLVGCSKEAEKPGVLAEGTKVTILEETETMARVRTPEGDERFVPRGQLIQRGDLDTGDHSHVISSDAPAYVDEPPASEVPPPRSSGEIIREQLTLNGVYMTPSGRKVVSRMNRGFEVDGEKAYPAYTCTNPDCPERNDADPWLFIRAAPGVWQCPACLKLRDLDSESPEERVRYRSYVRLYMPEETKHRIGQLDAERKQRYKTVRRPGPDD